MCYLENENIDINCIQKRYIRPSKIIGCCKKYNCSLKYKQAIGSCFKINKFNYCMYFEPNLLHSYWIEKRYRIPKEEDLNIFDDTINIFCDASFYKPIAICVIVVVYKNDIIDKKQKIIRVKNALKAEAHAVRRALQYIKDNNIQKNVYVYSDCLQSIVKKNEYYNSNLMSDNICLKWIPRKLNKLADRFTQCIV